MQRCQKGKTDFLQADEKVRRGTDSVVQKYFTVRQILLLHEQRDELSEVGKLNQNM